MTAATADPTALGARVAASLARQGVKRHLGVRLVDVAPGTLALWYSDRSTLPIPDSTAGEEP